MNYIQQQSKQYFQIFRNKLYFILMFVPIILMGHPNGNMNPNIRQDYQSSAFNGHIHATGDFAAVNGYRMQQNLFCEQESTFCIF